MLEKSGGRPRLVSPRDAAVRRHFYSLDVEGRREPVIEMVLGVIESQAAPMLAQLDHGRFPFGSDRLNLGLFVATCLLRTPAARERMASLLEQATAAMMAESYRVAPPLAQRALADSDLDLTPDEIEELRLELISDLDSGRITFEIPKNNLLKHFLDGSISVSWTLFMFDWTLVRATGPGELVLPDTAVSIYDPRPAFPGGGTGVLTSPNTALFLPFASDRGLLVQSNEEVFGWARANLEALRKANEEDRIAMVEDHEGTWSEGEPTEEFVRELNLRSYAQADKYVFGSQRAVTELHASRRRYRRRLAQVSTRSPSFHIVEDDPERPGGVRVTRTYRPRPRRR